MRSGDRETCLIAYVYLFTFKLSEITYSPAHHLVVVLNKLSPAGAKYVSRLLYIPTGYAAQLATYSVEKMGYFSGLWLPGSTFDRSPPSRTQLKNSSCTSLPSICLYVAAETILRFKSNIN